MFDNKRVIVTGGAGALGGAVVNYYESKGAFVAILDYSDELLNASYPKKMIIFVISLVILRIGRLVKMAYELR